MDGFIKRQLAETITEAARYFSVICLTGPRQSGKSTLIHNLFADYRYYSMEDYEVKAFAESDPVSFLNNSEDGMVIDEIQRVPMLLSYIQGIVDSNPQRRFVISGSSNFLLLKNISQSLAGRVGVFELLPMSYAEMKDRYAIKPLDEILYEGMYPAVCSGKNIARFMYPSYVKTYLDKDVRELINVKDMSLFHRFLKLCAGRIGSVFNASELAGDVGVSSHTIEAWLSVLEASYIIVRLQPWYENTRKRLVKSPKIYFTDTGLACYLLSIESPTQLSTDKMRGHLFENFVVMEALKRRYNEGRESNIFYYRDAKKNEIDLLVTRGDALECYEVKSSQTYNRSFEDVLRHADTLLTTSVCRKVVVYAGDFENTAGEVEILNFRNLAL